MAAPATTEEILDVNRRYHDVAAADYDAKWGVDFGAVGRAQVLGKVCKLLGRPPGHFPRALEIGAGTGYFTLNLMQEGVIGAGVVDHARRDVGARRMLDDTRAHEVQREVAGAGADLEHALEAARLAAEGLAQLADDLGLAGGAEVDAPLRVVAGGRPVVVARVDVTDLLGGGGRCHAAGQCTAAFA